MRYIPAYRVWLDNVRACPYGDYDYVRKHIAGVFRLIKYNGEAYYFINCKDEKQKELIFAFAEAHGIEEYVTADVHEEEF